MGVGRQTRMWSSFREFARCRDTRMCYIAYASLGGYMDLEIPLVMRVLQRITGKVPYLVYS